MLRGIRDKKRGQQEGEENVGIKNSKKKIKCVTLGWKCEISMVVGSKLLECEEKFKYFDHIITEDFTCTTEVKVRICMGEKDYQQKV